LARVGVSSISIQCPWIAIGMGALGGMTEEVISRASSGFLEK